MITVAEAVSNHVEQSPYLQDALSRQLINLSALARELQPVVAEQLMKDVSDTAVFMALKRYSEKLHQHPKYSQAVGEFFGDITVKSDLFEVVVVSTDSLIKKLQKVMHQSHNMEGSYLTHTSGIRHTALVASNNLQPLISKGLAGEKITKEFNNLSAITIHFVGDYMETAGLYEYPIKLLAWAGISITEVVSAYSELTLVIESRDVDRAFSILHKSLGHK